MHFLNDNNCTLRLHFQFEIFIVYVNKLQQAKFFMNDWSEICNEICKVGTYSNTNIHIKFFYL